MPFKSKAQARWMFANHPKMAKKFAAHTRDEKGLPDKVSEMPHMDINRNVAGEHLGTVDLRIERYPISPEEKKKLMSSFFSGPGVLARTKGNHWILFGRDETREAHPDEIKTLPKLPDDWEKYSVATSEAPAMHEVFRTRKVENGK